MHRERGEERVLLAVAVEAAGGRDEMLFRLLVGNVLHDDGALGQHLAVVELKRGNVALGIDFPEIVAARGLLVRDVDFLQIEFITSIPPWPEICSVRPVKWRNESR